MTPDVDDADQLPCPVTGCTDTLGNCLRRADLLWPDDPHAALITTDGDPRAADTLFEEHRR